MIFLKYAALAALSALDLTLAQTALPAPELVALGGRVVGGPYRPATRTNLAKLAIFVMHSGSDYIKFVACTELASRGFTVFCAKTTLANQNVGLGTNFLRSQTNFEKVILFGHSGGGAMMAAYQNIAENGLSACNGDEKILPRSDDLAGLRPADGIVLVDANYGTSTMTLLSINPALEDETTSAKLNESLDLFNPANGYTDNGANYSATFTKLFQSGVAALWQRIMNYAEDRGAAILAGNGAYTDDEPFYVPDTYFVGGNDKFFAQDARFLARTVHAWPLLHKNGSSTTQIIHSTIINRFLRTFAVRVNDDFAYDADSFSGIDWASSHLATQSSVTGISVLPLTMGMTGHWEYLAAENIYLNAVTNDKSIAFVEGASHTIDVCRECESYPGEYGDTVKTCFDYMADWLAKKGRFV